MKILGALFGLGAILCALVGLVSLSEATMGVGIVGLGAISGILARLCQADAQHTELQRKLDQVRNETDLVKRILVAVHNVDVE